MEWLLVQEYVWNEVAELGWKQMFSLKRRLSGKMIFSQFFSFQKIDFNTVFLQAEKLILVKFFRFSRFIELKPSRRSILDEKTVLLQLFCNFSRFIELKLFLFSLKTRIIHFQFYNTMKRFGCVKKTLIKWVISVTECFMCDHFPKIHCRMEFSIIITDYFIHLRFQFVHALKTRNKYFKIQCWTSLFVHF